MICLKCNHDVWKCYCAKKSKLTGLRDNHEVEMVKYKLNPQVTEAFNKLINQLSEQQYGIFELRCQGFEEKDVAIKLGISYNTVRTQIERMWDKYKQIKKNL